MPRTHTKQRDRKRMRKGIAAAVGVGVGVTSLLAPLAQATASAGEPDATAAGSPGAAFVGAYARVLPGGDAAAPGGRFLDRGLDAGEWPLARQAGVAGTAGAQETYEITEKGIGDDGRPLTIGEEWETYAINLDTAAGYGADDRLPPGDYAVVSIVDAHILQVHTLLDLNEDTTVTFDTREATPVDLSVYDAEAKPAMTSAGLVVPGESVGIGITYFTRGPELVTFRTQYSGPEVPAERMVTNVGTSWANDEGAEYHAGYEGGAELFDGFAHRVSEDELARIDLREGSPTDGAGGLLQLFGEAHLFLQEVTLPRTTSHYVTGGEWYKGLDVPDPAGDGVLGFTDEYGQVYEPGRTYESSINVGPFAPTMTGSWLYRQGDQLLARTILLADSAGHAPALGYEGSTTLRRNGEVLETLDAPLYRHQFALPREGKPAAYELTTTFRRNAPLSSEVTLSFAFDSATPPPAGQGQRQELLSMVAFSPELALDSTAPAGERMAVPVTVHGAAAGKNLGSLSVEVSYDGGSSWQEAPVTTGGGGPSPTVSVDNPAAGGSVSFRATATDRDGNATTLTVVDAYRTR